jgi:choloylglycine hydrolase
MDLYTSDEAKIIAWPQGETRNGLAGKNSLTWQSKYGSVVITAFNSPVASDGMNEQGLAAHLLYLTGSVYPQKVKNNKLLSNLMLAQYMLDNFKTVNEAVTAASLLNLIPTKVHGRTWPVHLTLEDPSGDSAILEYIDGKLIIYHGKQYKVMTNEPPFNVQLANLKRYKTFGGKLPIPGYPDPMSRFVRASYYLKTLPKATTNLNAVANLLSVMRSAMVPFGAVDKSGNKTEDAWATRWVSIADLKNKIYYFNSTTTPNIVWVTFSKLNFNAGTQVRKLDPNQLSLIGDITEQLS